MWPCANKTLFIKISCGLTALQAPFRSRTIRWAVALTEPSPLTGIPLAQPSGIHFQCVKGGSLADGRRGEAWGCPGLYLHVSGFSNGLIPPSLRGRKGPFGTRRRRRSTALHKQTQASLSRASQVRGHSWKRFHGKFRVAKGTHRAFYCDWLIYALFTLRT